MVVLTVLVFGGSMIGIAALISWDRMHEDDIIYEKLNALYVESLPEQERLELAFNTNNDVLFIASKDQLSMFFKQGLRVIRSDDIESPEAKIINDMFYCYVTPEETMGRLADLRHMRKRVPSMSPVRFQRAYDR